MVSIWVSMTRDDSCRRFALCVNWCSPSGPPSVCALTATNTLPRKNLFRSWDPLVQGHSKPWRYQVTKYRLFTQNHKELNHRRRTFCHIWAIYSASDNWPVNSHLFEHLWTEFISKFLGAVNGIHKVTTLRLSI